MSRFRKVPLLLLPLLFGCGFYREQLGSYYGVASSSKALTEKAIISLIQDGTLQTKVEIWRPLVEQGAARLGGRSVGNWVDTTYVLGYRERKGFVVFHLANHTFYSFDFCNCGAPVQEPEGLVGPNCDLRIGAINVFSSDSTLRSVAWKDAGPALAEFRKSILPLIRRRAASYEQE